MANAEVKQGGSVPIKVIKKFEKKQLLLRREYKLRALEGNRRETAVINYSLSLNTQGSIIKNTFYKVFFILL